MDRQTIPDLPPGRCPVMDGGLAAMLLSHKQTEPGFCPEVLLPESPEEVSSKHAGYARAGAEIPPTATFGGDRACTSWP